MIENTATASRDFKLFNTVHQLRPVLDIMINNPALTHLAMERYLSSQEHQSSTRVSKILSMLMLSDQPWLEFHQSIRDQDVRMLPDSAQVCHESSVTSCNKAVLLSSLL